MTSRKNAIGMLLIILAASTTRLNAQASEIEDLFHNLEVKAARGLTSTDEADAVVERLAKASGENVAEALPLIIHETSNPYVSVRRIAALTMFEITTRQDGKALLSGQTATFSALLTDTDIPIRRVTGLAINNLHLDASSPLVPVLEAFLAREDAVSTVGPGVAGLLMQAAPSTTDSTSAVVQFMRRLDQTSKSRHDTLQSIQVARSSNREIGKEVAAYADDPDEQLSIQAIETLQHMGKSTILDSQPTLSRIAADTTKPSSVRVAATKALSAVP